MSDLMTIQKGKVLLTTEEGQKLEKPESLLEDMLREEYVPPLHNTALPDGVKFYEWRPPYFLVVHQMPPHVRQFRWISKNSKVQFGPGTEYRKVRLSIPYSITFAMYFHQGDGLFISGNNELYFRNEPLRSKDDKLGYPALLNISRIDSGKRKRAWICTQYLNFPDGTDWTGQLQALLDHIWNGGFNLSSEHHEGASWYGESKGIHTDLHPVEKWEKATANDDAFALSVPWKPVPMTVGDLMECMFDENNPDAPKPKGKRSKRSKTASLVSRFMNFAQRS